MNKKVEKLVKKIGKTPIWMPDGEVKRTVGTDLAKQILSENNLALIDEMCYHYKETGKQLAYVIPLAEELKE